MIIIPVYSKKVKKNPFLCQSLDTTRSTCLELRQKDAVKPIP